MDGLAGAQWFSTLDLCSGYWQVEVAPEDRSKTAFYAGFGLYQFVVMPFGLCNAPSTFERLMDLALQGLHWNTCLIYLDDVIVHAKTFKDEVEKLRTVFERFKKSQFEIERTKMPVVPKASVLFRTPRVC